MKVPFLLNTQQIKNAKTPNKVYGIKILEDEFRGEGGYFYVIPQAFKEATQGYPRNMALKSSLMQRYYKAQQRRKKAMNINSKSRKKCWGDKSRLYKNHPNFRRKPTKQEK